MTDMGSSPSNHVSDHEMSDSEIHQEVSGSAGEQKEEQAPLVTPTPTPPAPKPIRGAAAAAAERKLKVEAERKEELRDLIKEAIAGILPPQTEKPKKKRSAPQAELETAPTTKKTKKAVAPVPAPQKKVAGVSAKAPRQAGPTSKKLATSGPKKIPGAGQTGATKKGTPIPGGKKAAIPDRKIAKATSVTKKGAAAVKAAPAAAKKGAVQTAPVTKTKPIERAYAQPVAAPTRLGGMYSQIFAR